MIGIVLVLLLVLGPCTSPGPPSPTVTEEQMRLLNQSLEALHEEVAAARSPSTWPFVLFIVSLLVPLLAGIWILVRAERSVIGADETIRTLVRHGLSEPVVRLYLDDQAGRPHRPEIGVGPTGGHALSRPRETHQRTRKRRRRRKRKSKRHPDQNHLTDPQTNRRNP